MNWLKNLFSVDPLSIEEYIKVLVLKKANESRKFYKRQAERNNQIEYFKKMLEIEKMGVKK